MINRYTADRRLRHDDAYTPIMSRVSVRIAPHWFIPNGKEAWKDVLRSSAVLRLKPAPQQL